MSAKRSARDSKLEALRKPLWDRAKGLCDKCHGQLIFHRFDMHHIASRGKYPELVLELDNLMAVHRKCHGYIELHPDEAREKGWRR